MKCTITLLWPLRSEVIYVHVRSGVWLKVNKMGVASQTKGEAVFSFFLEESSPEAVVRELFGEE